MPRNDVHQFVAQNAVLRGCRVCSHRARTRRALPPTSVHSPTVAVPTIAVLSQIAMLRSVATALVQLPLCCVVLRAVVPNVALACCVTHHCAATSCVAALGLYHVSRTNML